MPASSFRVDRKFGAERPHFGAHRLGDGIEAAWPDLAARASSTWPIQDADTGELSVPKPRVVPALLERRRPEATSAGSGSKGIRFLLQVRPAASRQLRGRLAGQPLGPQIDQDHAGVGAAGDQAQAGRDQGLGQRGGVVEHRLVVGP